MSCHTGLLDGCSPTAVSLSPNLSSFCVMIFLNGYKMKREAPNHIDLYVVLVMYERPFVLLCSISLWVNLYNFSLDSYLFVFYVHNFTQNCLKKITGFSYKVYYPVRHHLVQHMISAMQRLGFTPSVTIEQRKLAVDLAEVVIKWELQRIKDQQVC